MAGKVFSDVYNESARDTGDQTTSHVTYVKKKVNDALRVICSEMEYSWLKRKVDITLVASQQYVNVSDFASDWDEDTPMKIWYADAGNQRVVLDVFDEEEWAEEEDTDEGDPYGFHLSQEEAGVWKVYFVYVPNSAFVNSYSPLKCLYQKYPTELSGDSDVPEIPTSQHQALVWKTNELICAEMGDTEGMASWGRLADKGLGKLRKKQVHRLGRPKRVYPRGAVLVRGNARRSKDYNL